MSDAWLAGADDETLLKAAAAGDEQAFAELVGAHRGELRAHCYRMLGSLPDAEDALQDALVRAWRGLSGFQGRSSVRSWLYAIVTNAALDMARRRTRRELPVAFGPASGHGADMAEPALDAAWLGPFPDGLLARVRADAPEARYEQRESVELAFVVALQELPPLQRAVFILRDVLGFPAAQTASQLGTSVASVTSALQRARSRVRDSLPARSQQAELRVLGDERIRSIAARYADALERGDPDTLIRMLTDGATWCMPPIPSWFGGHEGIREFLVRWPLTYRWQHVPVRANGQLAVAGYLFDADRDRYVPAVVDVLTMAGEKIAAVTAFMTPDAFGREPAAGELSGSELFALFGLPDTPGQDAGPRHAP
jgi:RNA polymerase sigma-70 factor (ECF subfamily)